MFRNLLLLAIFTTISVLAWIGFNIYHSFATSTISEDTNMRIIPIPQTFNIKTIEGNLNSRKKIDIDLSERIAIATPTSDIITIVVPQSSSSSILENSEPTTNSATTQ